MLMKQAIYLFFSYKNSVLTVDKSVENSFNLN